MSQQLRYSLLFAGLGALFFIPFLGGVRLFDWDEINFAECAREMLVLHDYGGVHVDFQPFYEKPPVFFWCQAVAMKLFGVGPFAARLPNAVCGIATLVYLYNLGRRLHSHRFGVVWALVYLGSITPHLYFRSGIIDPYFNLFIFIGVVELIAASWKRASLPGIALPYSVWTYLFVGGFILGIGITTKGPVAYLIVCLTLGVYWLLARFRWFITPIQFVVFSLAATLTTLVWYGLETYAHGPLFIREFIQYNYRLFSTPDAGHSGFLGYHFVVLLLGCFPASVFGIRGMGNLTSERDYQRDFRRWMLILFWVVLILFSIVQSKIVHYSSMCYFPLTYLATLTLTQLEIGRIRFNAWLRAGLIGIGGVLALVVIVAPFVGQHIEWLKPFVENDPFASANLNARIHWTGWEALAGVWLLVVLVLSIRGSSRGKLGRGTASSGWTRRATMTLFGGMAVFITLTLWGFIGRIEGISQAASMRFFERMQGRDVYVWPYGYRSYGAFFNTLKAPPTNPNYYKLDWLLHGPVDKDVYFSAKNILKSELDALPDARFLYEENGFVFYRRQAITNKSQPVVPAQPPAR